MPVLAPEQRFQAHGRWFSDETLQAQPGLNIADMMGLSWRATRPCSGTSTSRRRWMKPPTCCWTLFVRASIYLVAVGLDYLTLDRQSVTHRRGEVQRINLTTALGTSW